MHRGIAPSLIEKASLLVEEGEEIQVLLRTKPVQASNFEVGPLEASVS